MKKIVVFVVLVLFSGVVCATMNFDGSNREGSLHIERGWNLVYGFFSLDQLGLSGDISTGDIGAIYAYIPTIKEYARAYPEPEVENLRQMDDDELLNTAFWVYSDKSGTMVYEVYDNSYIPFEERQLYSGWNFVGLMSEIKMKKLREFKGNCNIEKIVFWQNQQWEVITPESLSQSTHSDAPDDFQDLVLVDSDANVGMGLIVYVSDDCNFDVDGGNGGPPQLPVENSQISANN